MPSLPSAAATALLLALASAATSPATACPFLLGQSIGGRAPAARRRLASAYPAPGDAFAGFLPGTLTSSLAAIAKTLAPQTVKATVDRYVSAAAAWNVTALDGVDGAEPHVSRLEAAVSAVEASLAADKAGSSAPDTFDGSTPDGPLEFAEVLFKALMYPIPPSLFLRLAFHDCGSWNKAAAAVRSGGRSGVGPSQGGCNGSVRFELGRSGNYGLGVTWPVVNFGWKVKREERMEGKLESCALRAGELCEVRVALFSTIHPHTRPPPFPPSLPALLQVLQHKFPDLFSVADAIAIAGAAGVRAAFGPVMHVGYGRVDSSSADPDAGPASNPQVGKDFGPEALSNAWLTQYALSPASLCTLLGAHTFGISSVSVPVGVFAPTGPLLFTNTYYRRVADGTANFPVDNALAEIPETAGCVATYAANQAAFFEGFSREYRGMTWWGQEAARVVGIEGGADEGEWRPA